MLPNQPDQTPVNLYNPDLKDFTFVLADDNNVQHEYILHSQEITTLPKYIADHGASKLADMLVWKRGVKSNYELDKKNILEEIYVQI